MKIYLVFIKNKSADPKVEIVMDRHLAIKRAKTELLNESFLKPSVREFNVVNFHYFGVNLGEGIMAWVEEQEIALPAAIFTTSSSPMYTIESPYKIS